MSSADRPVRVGFIGCGGHAARNVLPAFAFTPIELVAACDLDAARAAQVGRRFGATETYTDAAAILAREDIEAVFIVVGADAAGRPVYPQLVTQALEAGKHVWFEKPPAATVAELRPVHAAACASGKHVMCGLKKMFAPGNRKAASLIRREGFEPSLLLAQYPQEIPTAEELATYQAGQFVGVVHGFLDHLCHPASLILGLFGAPQRLWYAASAARSGVATFEYDDGRIAQLALTSGQANNAGLERTVIVGAGGQHVVVENNIRVYYHRNAAPLGYGTSTDYFAGDPGNASVVWEPEFSLGQPYNKALMLLGYFNEVNEFARCVQAGTAPTCGTLQHAAQVTAIFEAFAAGPHRLTEIEYDPAFA